MRDVVEPIIGWCLLVAVPGTLCASAWVLWGHRHRWQLVLVTDSVWPVEAGHAVRRCYCGKTKPVDNSR